MEQQYLPRISQDQTLVSDAQDLWIIRHHPHLSLFCLCEVKSYVLTGYS